MNAGVGEKAMQNPSMYRRFLTGGVQTSAYVICVGFPSWPSPPSDLAVTPFSLLRNSLQELDRLIAACGNRHILILGTLPRFFLKTWCDNLSHCANISRHDETQVEAGKKFMQDLEDLNSQLAARLNSRNVQFVFTGDVISGKNRCSIGDLADCLFTCWRSDPCTATAART